MQLKKIEDVIRLDKERKHALHELEILENCHQINIGADWDTGPNTSYRGDMFPKKGEALFEAAISVMAGELIREIEEIEQKLKDL